MPTINRIMSNLIWELSIKLKSIFYFFAFTYFCIILFLYLYFNCISQLYIYQLSAMELAEDSCIYLKTYFIFIYFFPREIQLKPWTYRDASCRGALGIPQRHSRRVSRESGGVFFPCFFPIPSSFVKCALRFAIFMCIYKQNHIRPGTCATWHRALN